MTSSLALWRLFAAASALLPGLVLVAMFFRLGGRRLSPRLMGVGLASGAMVAVIPAFFNTVNEVALRPKLEYVVGSVVTAFGFAGLLEETAKLAASYFLVRPYFERRSPGQLLIATATVGLGFALIENMTYVLRYEQAWEQTAIGRAITAVPMHAFVGLTMGWALARVEGARTQIERLCKILLGLLTAVAMHGLYDLALFLNAKSPLYPTAVISVAAALHLLPITLLHGLLLISVALMSVGAVVAMNFCRFDAALPNTRALPTFTFKPQVLNLVSFSKTAGFGIAGLVMTVAALLLAYAGDAVLNGALALSFIDIAIFGVVLLSIAYGFAVQHADAHEDRPRGPAETSTVPWFRRSHGLALALSIGAVGLSLGIVARTKSVGFLLTISGNTRRDLADIDGAIRDYDRAIQLDPGATAPLGARAEVFKVQQRYDLALAEITKALAIAPTDRALTLVRANLLGLMHREREALQDYDRYLEAMPYDVEALTMRAYQLSALGENDRALADVGHAIDLDPRAGQAHAAKAAILEDQGQSDDAIRELTEALTINPLDRIARFARGRINLTKGSAKAALPDLALATSQGAQPYAMLWLFIARRRNNEDGQRELATWASSLPQTLWPIPIARYYLGLRSQDAVYAAAANDDQKCEADFYIGVNLLHVRRVEEARALLTNASINCPRSFIEQKGALNELATLQKAPAVRATVVQNAQRSTPPQPRINPVLPVGQADATLLVSGNTYDGTIEWRLIRANGRDGSLQLLEISERFPNAGLSVNVQIKPDYSLSTGEAFVLATQVRVQPKEAIALSALASSITLKQGGQSTDFAQAFLGPPSQQALQRISMSADVTRRALSAIADSNELLVSLALEGGRAAVASFKMDQASSATVREALYALTEDTPTALEPDKVARSTDGAETVRQLANPAAQDTRAADAYRSQIEALLALQRDFPDSEKARGLNGTTVLAFRVDESGAVTDATIQTSSGLPDLDEAAIEALRGAAPFGPPPTKRPPQFVVSVPFGR